MLEIKDKGILLQIIKRCKRIKEKVLNITIDEFFVNEDIKEIICFNIFQIGELSSGLSSNFTLKYNEIPWKQVIGMRNKIINGYDTINIHIVWNTAKESITCLLEYCIDILG